MSTNRRGLKPNHLFLSRRRFLSTLTRTAVAGSLAGLEVSRFAHAAGDGSIRLGLVGCGGRGCGAVDNALKAGKDVRLVAMADVFDEKITQGLSALNKQANAGRLDVSPERRFTGFNAFQELLDSRVDALILATPPAFRPLQFEAAVAAGVHCFLEKPFAVDAPGVRQVRAAAAAARQKGLSSIVGLQEQFENSYKQCLGEIAGGALGKVIRLKAVIHFDDVPRYARRPALESQLGRPVTELEFQLRNWYPFVWLCGDMIVEVLVHQIDVCLRVMGRPPQQARGLAERREHTNCESGNLSDFLSATFTYPDGVEMQVEVSALAGSDRQWQVFIEGEKGTATIPNRIQDRQGQVVWSFSGPKNNPYDEEMNKWCASIRNGQPLNTLDSAADSTLTAILGRTAAYSGRQVTWKEILVSKEAFFSHNPKSLVEDPPCLPDKFGDYEFPARGLAL